MNCLRHILVNNPKLWIALWALISSGGCSQLASFTVVRPASVDVSGIRRLSVIPFSGEHGSAVASAVTNRLWENRFYALVDQTELSPIRIVSHETGHSHESIRHIARSVGVDGIITGEVIDYHCDDQVLRNSEFLIENDHAEHSDHHHDRLHIGMSHRNRIRREATVSVAFQVVDTSTGEVRVSHRASHRYHGEIADDQGTMPTRGEILDRLSDACVEEFLQMLVPYEEQCQMRLARAKLVGRGSSHVRRGNRLAIQGEWPAARVDWELAVADNPNCDAALYNLAVDAVAHQHFEAAEDLAMQAIRAGHCELYATGLEQIREYRAAFDLSQAQHQDREQTFPDRVWR